MTPKLGFTKDSPIYSVYEGLIRAGVRKEALDRGYTRIDYSKPGPNATKVNQWGVIEKQEVIDYALERDRFRHLVEGYLGRPLPWTLDDPNSDFDETVRNKIKDELKTIRPLLAEFKKGSTEYQERLAEVLFQYLYDPDERGMGLGEFKQDAPIEASALEALQLKKGWCTERSKILFAVFKTAGLKPQFVYVPSRAVQQFIKAKGLEVSSLFRNQDHVAIALRFGQRIRIFDLGIFDSDAKYQEYYLLGLRHFLSIDRNNRGLNLGVMERNNEAQIEFDESIRLSPEFPGTHTNLCSFQPDKRKLEELEVHCQRAIQLDPLSVTPHYALGTHYAAHKKDREAIALFKEALKIDSSHSNARFRLAKLLEGEGLKAEAIQEYKEVVRLGPGLLALMSCYQLTQLLFLRGEMQEAIPFFEEALKYRSLPPPLYFHYGAALWRTGRKKEAVSALENLHQAMVKELNSGQLTLDKLRSALKVLMPLVTPEMKRDPEAMAPIAALLVVLSARYRNEKRFEDAGQVLKKAYELDPHLKSPGQ